MARRGKNEGTIFRKPNGSWMAQVSIDGRRMSHGSVSRADCQAWVRRTLDQIDGGMTYEGRSLTLSAYLDEWISVKRNAIRASTAFQYEKLIHLYIVPGLGKVKLKDLTLRTVNLFYKRLVAQGSGISNVRYTHRVLHAALEQAARGGMIVRNPAHGAVVPKHPHREMQMLNEQEAGLLLMAAGASRYRSLYHLALVTGMRLSELRGLKWDDIDWHRGMLTVKRQMQDVPGRGPEEIAPKTRSGIRSILLGERTIAELWEQKKRLDAEGVSCAGWQDNGLVFPSSIGTAFAKTDLQRDYWRTLELAGVRRIRFHDLRHTAASLMLNHGVPAIVVSKILGHSNPGVTLTIYAHSTLEMQSEAAKIMDNIITPVAVQLPVNRRTSDTGREHLNNEQRKTVGI